MRIELLLSHFGLSFITIISEYYNIPIYIHMMIDCLLLIYIGSMYSIKAHHTPAGDSGAIEKMTNKDAYMFPIMGSGVLLSIYVAYKFLPKEYLNLMIKAYFFLIGILVLGDCFGKFIGLLLPQNTTKRLDKPIVSFNLPAFCSSKKEDDKNDDKNNKEKSNKPDVEISVLDVFGYMIAGVVAVWYIKTNHWIASNMFGMAFSIQGIAMLSMGSFVTGCILLIGLFFYDIFWVFGTDVMVTVAKSFDAPIKLFFPRNLGAQPPSMLGLGDIVIPGIFVAMMLRFDEHLKHAQTPKAAKPDGSRTHSDHYYFRCVLFGYFAGLSFTVFIMYYFNHPQPALLYLVPGVILSSVLAALWRGELSKLYNYTEHDDEETKKKE